MAYRRAEPSTDRKEEREAMSYVYVFLAGLLIALVAFSMRNMRSNKRPRQVLDNLEHFIEEMEAENDRFVEMVSHLRKKMDEENLSINNRIAGLTTEIRRLGDRLQSLERSSSFGVPEGIEKVTEVKEPPSFLSPKYQEVARLLIQGKETQTIAKELGIGRGEVDFVARLLESEREGQ